MTVSNPSWRSLITLIISLAVIGWLLVRWLRRSEDPIQLIVKWVLTAAILAFLFLGIVPSIFRMGQLGAALVPFVAACGVLLALLWAPNIGGWVTRGFDHLFLGGDRPPEPQPLYSMAEARRKRGRFAEAMAEVRKQLHHFPHDLTGHVLLAEIQAFDLRDLEAARETLEAFVAQPGTTPQNVHAALNTLADWELHFNADVAAARGALEEIIALIPDTPQAQQAAQRLAHLASPEQFARAHDHSNITLKPGEPYVGLLKDSSALRPAEEDVEKRVADLSLHLENHPLDTEAREQLAVLYSDHYHRLDLAAEQLERLIRLPHLPEKNRVRWLHLLADLQVKHGQPYEVVAQTLQRIIDSAPGTATETIARQRLDKLRLEIRGQTKSPSVSLGPRPKPEA